MQVDVLVIGGGAAGISAATLLGRACRTVALVDAGDPRNARALHSHGVVTRDGMSPAEFASVARSEAQQYGVKLINDFVHEITATDTVDPTFMATLKEGGSLEARSVLVATGIRDVLPDLPGVNERWGESVVHCPYCHGYEVRNSKIAVIGGENRPFTVHQAALVRQWSNDVTFFPNEIELTDEETSALTSWGVAIQTSRVAGICDGNTKRIGLHLDDAAHYEADVAFVGPRFEPQDSMLRSLGCGRNDAGWVPVDAEGRTTVAGVWAAGNVVSSPAQLINAASQGASAGISINRALLARDMSASLTTV